MDIACKGYPESTPNSFHNDRNEGNETIQPVNLHPQYPLHLLLLLLLLRYLSHRQYFRKREGYTPIQQ